MAEVFYDEVRDDGRSVVWVRLPGQLDARLLDVDDDRSGRRTGVRRRLRGPTKDDRRIRRRLDVERSTGCRLAGLTDRLTRVPSGVCST